MIVPERILEASRSVNEVLAGIDAAVKRLDRGVAREGESAEGALPRSSRISLRIADSRGSASFRSRGVVDRDAGASHSGGGEALVPLIPTLSKPWCPSGSRPLPSWPAGAGPPPTGCPVPRGR
ncbi:hypothetical protein SAMN06272771_4989 [Streptomyces sp. Ag82_O1-12]|nr:hypothetical protein SAMN06272771_4989 [Streptomyces sp. Ag82_O1-12]SOD47574.1 hypothetical protein SAMN06272727_4990 [Streptomyces sp. Ag82_G6-1]